MKKRWWILIIIIIVLLLVSIGLWIYLNIFVCSTKNPSICNVECDVDKDCQMSSCKCINVNENMLYLYPKGTMLKCDHSECSCINNKCTGTGNSSMLI